MGVVAKAVGFLVTSYFCAVGASVTARRVYGWYQAAENNKHIYNRV